MRKIERKGKDEKDRDIFKKAEQNTEGEKKLKLIVLKLVLSTFGSIILSINPQRGADK